HILTSPTIIVPSTSLIALSMPSLLSHYARNHSRADGGRRRAALPHRELADSRDSERHTGRDRDGNGVPDRRLVEPEDLAGAASRADGGEHALIPSLQGDSVRETAEHFVRGGDRRDDRSPIRSVSIARGQHGGNHVTRVARPPGCVGVVTVQISDE